MKKLIAIVVVILAIYYFSVPSPMALELPETVLNIEIKGAKQLFISQVPILMYHSISNSGGPWSELSVSPESFKEQMGYLVEQGYTTITLKDLYLHWIDNEPLPLKPIVLTFDDGYLDNYTTAFPIMNERGHIGVIFPYLNKVGNVNSVTWEHLLEFIDAGWEVGNHSKTHMDLTRANHAQLDREINYTTKVFEENLGVEIVSFCYPAGRYDLEVLEVLENSTLTISVTTNYGIAKAEENLLTLSRIRINRSDYLNGFIRKLERYEN